MATMKRRERRAVETESMGWDGHLRFLDLCREVSAAIDHVMH
jgi:hypothetical protein